MVIRNILLVPFMWCKLCYYAAHVDKYPEITRYTVSYTHLDVYKRQMYT